MLESDFPCLVTWPLSLSAWAIINSQIDLGDVTGMTVSTTSREPIVLKLLSNKQPETGEAVQELGKDFQSIKQR